MLAALVLLARPALTARVAAIAGGFLGLAVAVKLTYVVAVLVALVWTWFTAGRRPALRLVASAAASSLLVIGPIVLASPASAWRMIVVDQSLRGARDVGASRLALMVGASSDAVPHRILAGVLWALIAISAVVAVRTYRWSILWVGLLASNVVVLAATAVYFKHYSAVLAPAIALILGAGVQVAVDGARRRGVPGRTLFVVVSIAIACLVAVQLGFVRADRVGGRFPRAAVDRALGGSTCVTADSAAPLILTGWMARNIAHGCPVVVDFTGHVYEARGAPSRRSSEAFQAWAAAYLLTGDRIVLIRRPADQLDATTDALLAKRPVLLDRPQVLVLGPAP